MGLRRWVAGLVGGDASAAEQSPALELSVDVPARAASIEAHYGLAAADARRVAEILQAELGREEGYARTMIADRIAREVDLDPAVARTVVDTEVASIRTLARAEKFARQADGEVRYRWVDSVGRDDSPVCADVRAAIDERGPVTRDELVELLREAAAGHESGTPERADDLIPHERCRHTVVRHVDA
ncbi:MAG: hypothetical protein ABEJ31_07850 [Haloarculaceae archaeon]